MVFILQDVFGLFKLGKRDRKERYLAYVFSTLRCFLCIFFISRGCLQIFSHCFELVVTVTVRKKLDLLLSSAWAIKFEELGFQPVEMLQKKRRLNKHGIKFVRVVWIE